MIRTEMMGVVGAPTVYCEDCDWEGWMEDVDFQDGETTDIAARYESFRDVFDGSTSSRRLLKGRNVCPGCGGYKVMDFTVEY